MTESNIAAFIDYTLLKSHARARDIDALCQTASRAGFAAVCVNGIWVERAVAALRGSGVAVATVVGFPLGADPISVKVAQTRDLVGRGADEIDMVMSIGHLLDGDVDYVEAEIRGVVNAAAGRLVKVILETAALDRSQITAAVRAALAGKAQFVKTSTGFHPAGGATEDVVVLMAELAGESMGVKASGGIKDLATAKRMIVAGATRIGTSTDLSSAVSQRL